MFLYKVYEPCPALRPFIHNYSIVENSVALSHNILPRAALLLGIRYAGNMSLSTPDELVAHSFTSGLMGLQDSYRLFAKEAGTGMLAINFTETGASAFFRLPMNELYNGGYTLDNFIKQSLTAALEEQVALAMGADGRVRAAEAFLLTQLRGYEQDRLVLASLQAIRNANGVIRTEALAAQLYISTNRLEKRFRAIVGTSPKKFASMVRIASVIRGYRPGSSLTQLALGAGYFDQAHFNRDFKNYTGLTPGQMLNDRSGARERQQPCGFIYGGNLAPVQTDSL